MFDWLRRLRPNPDQVAVSEVAVLLDKQYPGWHRHVHTHRLSLNSSQHCVLGQVSQGMYGSFLAPGWERLADRLFHGGDDRRVVFVSNAFYLEFWVEEILARQQADLGKVFATEQELVTAGD